MSRINQALTTWESTRGAVADAEPRSEVEATVGALNQYAEELLHRYQQPPPRPDVRAPQHPTHDTAAADSEHRPTASPRAARDLEIEARLVTDPSNKLSTEQYRRMAATLHDLQIERQLKTVLVTSAVPQEGKTLTVVNLGLTLSESYGRRVLVMDADLRCPSLHRILRVPSGRGLCDALRESQRELPFISVSERLSVLAGGYPDGIPLAALSSPRMRDVIDECAARFDWVLIDTSPIGILPDASVLARLVGGVIFVIRAGTTPSAVVERAMTDIGPDAILGVVLNSVEERRIRTASYYNQYPSVHAKR
jgi:capsular exopolysaccharide synthesis family protein